MHLQEVEEKLKGLSPVMFEDFIKPFQINLDEVLSSLLLNLVKQSSWLFKLWGIIALMYCYK